MVSALISRVVILVFGTLYPAYSSYKAVKTKNVKEYVKWMMYWIVFALFTCVETFADVLIAWFPFYYELKICFVVWLLSPATKGSSILYRKFVHPELLKREGEIDLAIEKVKTQGYSAFVNVGQQGLNMAVQGAMTGQARVLDHVMKKSWSLGDISQQSSTSPVTYIPNQEQIPEASDETDYPLRADSEYPLMSNSVSADHLTSRHFPSHHYQEIVPSRDIGAIGEPGSTPLIASDAFTQRADAPAANKEFVHESTILSPRGAASGYNLRDRPAHEYHSSTAHSAQLEAGGLVHRNSSAPQYLHTQLSEGLTSPNPFPRIIDGPQDQSIERTTNPHHWTTDITNHPASLTCIAISSSQHPTSSAHLERSTSLSKLAEPSVVPHPPAARKTAAVRKRRSRSAGRKQTVRVDTTTTKSGARKPRRTTASKQS